MGTRGARRLEDIVISDVAAYHTLIDIVVVDPTRRVQHVARDDVL